MGKIIRGNFRKEASDVTVIIAAAGKGARMELGFNKLFLQVQERPIIAYTLLAFETMPLVDNIIVVANENDFSELSSIVREFEFSKVSQIVIGGNTRKESISKGLEAVPDSCDIVLVHDGARPLVNHEIIESTIDAVKAYGAAAVGTYATDTVKRVDSEGIIQGTLDRGSTVFMQTPQGFKKEIIDDMYKYAEVNGICDVTDDCVLAEKAGYGVKIVEGNSVNMKLTLPSDFVTISACLSFIYGDYEY